MYAEKITESMQRAISETNRRRDIQMRYNEEHGIVPKTIKKGIRDVIEATKPVDKKDDKPADKKDKAEMIQILTESMRRAAEELNFELAAKLRDEIKKLENN